MAEINGIQVQEVTNVDAAGAPLAGTQGNVASGVAD